MGKQFNADVISDTQADALPEGFMLVKFAEGSEDYFGDSGILTYNLRFNVIAPDSVDGMTLFHRAWVGSKDDPEADEERTQRRSSGLRLLKRICAVTGVNFRQDIDVVLEQLRDTEFVLRNTHRTVNETTYNNVKWAYAKGEVQPELKEPAPLPTNGVTAGSKADFTGFTSTAIDE